LVLLLTVRASLSFINCTICRESAAACSLSTSPSMLVPAGAAGTSESLTPPYDKAYSCHVNHSCSFIQYHCANPGCDSRREMDAGGVNHGTGALRRSWQHLHRESRCDGPPEGARMRRGHDTMHSDSHGNEVERGERSSSSFSRHGLRIVVSPEEEQVPSLV
jgi:hypothetical protein